MKPTKTKGLNLKASGSKAVKKLSKRGPRLTRVKNNFISHLTFEP